MNNDFLVSIGKRIAEIRRAHGITQETLAIELGVSPKHISHTECGTSSLSLKNLAEFCRLFDCSLDYIIFGNNKNDISSKLPAEIIHILYMGTDSDIERLNRYLQIYVELLNNNH